jgi:hypothetical protein
MNICKLDTQPTHNCDAPLYYLLDITTGNETCVDVCPEPYFPNNDLMMCDMEI